MPMRLHNLAREEGDPTAKSLTCGFSTARTCALIHREDNTVRAATVESQRGYGEVGNNEIAIWKCIKHLKITLWGSRKSG